jgi:hypothetical protein
MTTMMMKIDLYKTFVPPASLGALIDLATMIDMHESRTEESTQRTVKRKRPSDTFERLLRPRPMRISSSEELQAHQARVGYLRPVEVWCKDDQEPCAPAAPSTEAMQL